MYKPFSEQFRECNKNGNLVSVELLNTNIVLVCLKHKKQCCSSVCLSERTDEILTIPEPPQDQKREK